MIKLQNKTRRTTRIEVYHQQKTQEERSNNRTKEPTERRARGREEAASGQHEAKVSSRSLVRCGGTSPKLPELTRGRINEESRIMLPSPKKKMKWQFFHGSSPIRRRLQPAASFPDKSSLLARHHKDRQRPRWAPTSHHGHRHRHQQHQCLFLLLFLPLLVFGCMLSTFLGLNLLPLLRAGCRHDKLCRPFPPWIRQRFLPSSSRVWLRSEQLGAWWGFCRWSGTYFEG